MDIASIRLEILKLVYPRAVGHGNEAVIKEAKHLENYVVGGDTALKEILVANAKAPTDSSEETSKPEVPALPLKADKPLGPASKADKPSKK